MYDLIQKKLGLGHTHFLFLHEKADTVGLIFLPKAESAGKPADSAFNQIPSSISVSGGSFSS